MDSTQTITPLDLLRSLSVEEIEARLVDLDAEQQALRVLLRSLRARDRARGDAKQPEGRRDG